MFIDTRNLYQALSDELISLQWTPAGGSPEPLFDTVAYYHSEDLEHALQELFAYSASMAIIVPQQLDHQATESVNTLSIIRTLGIDIYFTGRSYSPTERSAHYMGLKRQGDGSWSIDDSRLGMADIAHQVLHALTGKKLGILPRPLIPGLAVPINLSDDTNLRPSYLLPFTCEAGDHNYPIL